MDSIDYRCAEGNAASLPDLVGELANLKVGVIVTAGNSPSSFAVLRLVIVVEVCPPTLFQSFDGAGSKRAEFERNTSSEPT